MRISSLITILCIIICSVVRAQQDPYLASIKRAISDIEKSYEYVGYGLKYAEAVENGKPVPSPTFLDGSENRLLAQVLISTVESLDQFNNEPEINLPAISVSDYASSLSIRTKAHAQMFKRLDSLGSLNKKWSGFLTQLQLASEYVQEIRKITKDLENKLQKLYEETGSGFTEISNLFGLQALKIHIKTRKQLSQIQKSLQESIKKIEKQQKSFIQDREVLYSNMSLLLKNQKNTLIDSLNHALDKQKLLENKAKLLNAKMILVNKKINLQQRKLDELAIEKEALINLKEKIQKNKSNASIYKNQAAAKKIEISYLTFCPNNQPWNACTHTSNKHEYSIKKQNLESEIETLNNKRIVSEDFVRDYSPRYAARATNYNAAIDNERENMNKLVEEKVKLDTSSDEITSEFLKYTLLINKYKNLTTEHEQHWHKYNNYEIQKR